MTENNIPKVLIDVAVLQAKMDALHGSFLNFLKDTYPDKFDENLMAFESVYKKVLLQKLSDIPEIDSVLRDEVMRQLGL
jgi:hypothetical protein